MRRRNVLVFPAGTEVGLEICNALKHCKEVALHGAGQDVSNHARFALPEYHSLPSIHEAGWLDELNHLIKWLEIDYIFPAYDDVIVALSQNADRISAVVLTPPLNVCMVTRSKSRTYQELSGKVRIPRVFSTVDEVEEFPVIVKPDRGQGSQGVSVVHNREDLDRAVRTLAEPLVCEYLPGEEYTVDCFSDRDKGVLFASARSRRRTKNGISVNTITEKIPEIRTLANSIGQTLGMRGAWFFQVKRARDGELALLEVAPRIAGGMATHRVAGVNFPLLTIFEEERLPLSILPIIGEIELDRALSNRYRHQVQFSAVYIDLDDTLLLHGAVNLQVIRLIYQCINQGKKLNLITRHQGNLVETLEKHRLQHLFDKIIHVPYGVPKSSYITEPNAIFIDDSFSERLDVATNCGIPTFDCSMIELLTDQAEFLSRS